MTLNNSYSGDPGERVEALREVLKTKPVAQQGAPNASSFTRWHRSSRLGGRRRPVEVMKDGKEREKERGSVERRKERKERAGGGRAEVKLRKDRKERG